MSPRSAPLSLGQFARAGFRDLSGSREALVALAKRVGRPVEELLDAFGRAADPDVAVARIAELAERHPSLTRGLGLVEWSRLTLIVGASPALGEFFARHPERLIHILRGGGRLVGAQEARSELLRAVRAAPADPASGPPAHPPVLVAGIVGEEGWIALRVRYRELLAETMLFDLEHGALGEAAAVFGDVAAALSDLADAALEAALAIARGALISGSGGPPVPPERVAGARLAVVAMGKCGAQELNVVSDVDVMFIAEPAEPVEGAPPMDTEGMLRVAIRLAAELMRAIHDPALEPPLWQVDPNLRPEGKQGVLVRTLGSMLSYYDRWAKTWEFQALLKARASAGDIALGEEFVARTRAQVWASASREDFVGSVQRMRERVTEHIDGDDLEVQLKLGPGGLRDIEFSVQLLQLVHGQREERLHLRGTLPAIAGLVAGGYIARGDGERLAEDYRTLRVIEHRLQLRELRRTALMPRDEEALRVLARATGLATTAERLVELWEAVRLEVRTLHLKIFYAPLLGAVASLPEGGIALGGEEARERLASIGFRDPDGAIRHLAALSSGNSRNARIQRNLLPVLLQWIASGTDPDFGLLAFRRVSEANRETPWYLRLLRDGAAAAERLTRVLSTSRFAAELLESIPEAVAWLERDELLRPVPLDALLEEMRSLVSRRDSIDDAAAALRAVHRREVLRLALGRLAFVNDDDDVAAGLDAAHTALLDGLLLALRADADPEGGSPDGIELALIGMGRYGGRELGFASDIDLIAVYRPVDGSAGGPEPGTNSAQRTAERLIGELRRLVADPRFAVDLDFDLRPEGRGGPIVRSLDAYRAYYERWSLTWEAQALLRARPVAGDVALGRSFIELADRIRYPEVFSDSDVREVRRIKARVEAERLPQGAEPRRHLKLGPGGISDVEWLVQLLQLRSGRATPELRTVSTLGALSGACEAGLLDTQSAGQLEAAWRLASSIRSAVRLWSGRGSDVLPNDRTELEGIARVLGMPRGRTSELEERWLAAARRSRAVIEREFFGYTPDSGYPATRG